MDICRLCLENSSKITSIFIEKIIDGEVIPMTQMIALCTGLEITKTDSMPQNLCDKCLNDLHQAFSFRQRCWKSTALLKEQINLDSFIAIKDESNFEEFEEIDFFNVDCVTNEGKLDDRSGIDKSFLECVESQIHKTKQTINNDSFLSACKILQECDICKKKFTKYDLKIHKRIHTGEKPYNCCYCDYKANRSYTVRQHVVRKHSKEINTAYTLQKTASRHTEEENVDETNQCDIPENTTFTEPQRKESKLNYSNKSIKSTSKIKILYPCGTCNKKFTKGDLKVHCRIHTGEKPFSCNYCEYRGARPYSVTQHIKRNHLKNTKYRKHSVINQIDPLLETNTELVNSSIKYEENFDDINTFLDKNENIPEPIELQLNKNIEKLNYVKRVIPKSKNTSSSEHGIFQKMEENSNDEAMLVKTKNNSFPEEHNLIKKKQNHFNENTLLTSKTPFTCETCNKKFKMKHDLKIHSRIHSGEKPYSCSYCEYRASKRYSVSVHIARIHSDKSNIVINKNLNLHFTKVKDNSEPLYICNICDYRAKFPEALKIHIITIHPEKTSTLGQTNRTKSAKEISHTFNVCNRTFKTLRYLRNHTRIHTGEKPYSCNLCDYRATGSAALLVHMRRHTGEKKFICELCGLKFITSSSLIEHKRTHTGEKLFDCPICYKSFSIRYSLNEHMAIHDLSKQHTCEYCGKKFAKKWGLSLHRKSHTGEKTYICDICQKGFIQRCSWRTHMKNVHLNI